MRPFVRAISGCLLCLAVSASARADLTGDINLILHDRSLVKSQVGVEIVRLGATESADQIVYRSNCDVPMIPASNLKLVTTSAALQRLGPDFKFQTRLVFHDGQLILIGDGDPSFGDAELLSRVGWDVTTVYQQWADQIKQLHLGPLKGVVVDDSIFDQDFFNADWSANQRLNDYEAEVAGMNLNANCLDFYIRPTQPGKPVICLTDPQTHFATIENQCVTGEGRPSITRRVDGNDMVVHGKCSTANTDPLSITVRDPSMYAATVLAETLAHAGVQTAEAPRRDRTLRDQFLQAQAGGDKSWQLLAVHETPLAQVISRANKDSMNLYGECLCKRMGTDASHQPGGWKNGTEAVGDFLSKIGVDPAQFRLRDGCGLSKLNRVSAAALIHVLEHDYFSPQGKIFVASLSVAGADGTLKNRFVGSTLRGRVFAKTGTVDGVSCLSGYVNARDGNFYAFSILVNNNFNGAGKPIEEKIVEAVDGGRS